MCVATSPGSPRWRTIPKSPGSRSRTDATTNRRLKTVEDHAKDPHPPPPPLEGECAFFSLGAATIRARVSIENGPTVSKLRYSGLSHEVRKVRKETLRGARGNVCRIFVIVMSEVTRSRFNPFVANSGSLVSPLLFVTVKRKVIVCISAV